MLAFLISCLLLEQKAYSLVMPLFLSKFFHVLYYFSENLLFANFTFLGLIIQPLSRLRRASWGYRLLSFGWFFSLDRFHLFLIWLIFNKFDVIGLFSLSIKKGFIKSKFVLEAMIKRGMIRSINLGRRQLKCRVQFLRRIEKLIEVYFHFHLSVFESAIL